ncbi:YncE family protein [Flavobacterium anhuiense]|mgnify:FL=1|uniref:YncE family protein n=1 Tax=Flavobacterium anhuiense TaxID=459526 RepID=UPI003D961CEE
MKKSILQILFGLSIALSLVSCREDETIFISSDVNVAAPRTDGKIEGFYLLNEGNMGMNRASLDVFNYRTGNYTTDVYSERNPSVVKELGDVGNDIKIYGNKVYAVINVSNKVEVLEKWTAKRIKKIDIPNCRYVTFYKDKAYVSSYSGPVAINPNAEIGFVAEIDTTSLEIKRKVTVGYQPEQMVVHNGKLYVANSGGYRVPNYDRTVSVIDLETFTEIKKIDVGINLYSMEIDSRGDIYVSSRGDYYNTPSNLFVIDSKTDEKKTQLDIPVLGMCLVDDLLYYYSVSWSYLTNSNQITYGILDTKTKKIISDKIITDGTDKQIMIPYGLQVNPETKEIYITDAQNYVVTGYIYCFTPEGKLKWKTTAGNIPAHIAFITKN